MAAISTSTSHASMASVTAPTHAPTPGPYPSPPPPPTPAAAALTSRSGTASPNPAGTIGGHRSAQTTAGQHHHDVERFSASAAHSASASGTSTPALGGGGGGGGGLGNGLPPPHFSHHDIWRSLHSASPSFKSAREGSGANIWSNNTWAVEGQGGAPGGGAGTGGGSGGGFSGNASAEGPTFLMPRLKLDDHSSDDAQGKGQGQGASASDIDQENTPNALTYSTNLPSTGPASSGASASGSSFFMAPIGTRSTSSGSNGAGPGTAAGMSDFNLSTDQAGLGITSAGSAGNANLGPSSANTSLDSVHSASFSHLRQQLLNGISSGQSPGPLSLQTQQLAQRMGNLSGAANSPLLSPAAASFVSASASSVGVASPTIFTGPHLGQNQRGAGTGAGAGYPFPHTGGSAGQHPQAGHKPTASGSSLGSGVGNVPAQHQLQHQAAGTTMPQLNLPLPHEQPQRSATMGSAGGGGQPTAQGGATRQGSFPPAAASPRHSSALGGTQGGGFGVAGGGNAGGGGALPPFVHRASGLRQGPHGPGSFSSPNLAFHQGQDPSMPPPPPTSFDVGPAHSEAMNTLEGLARANPLVADIWARLVRLELSVGELHGKMDASLALHGAGGSGRVGLGIDGSSSGSGPSGAGLGGGLGIATAEEMRMLRAQVSMLSSSVAQFLVSQQGQGPFPAATPGQSHMQGRASLPSSTQAPNRSAIHQQLAGLGLGTPSLGLPGDMSPNPALSIGAVAGTPVGDRSASPMAGGPGGPGAFGGGPHMASHLDVTGGANRLSPRPQGGMGGGANAANRLSWHGMPTDPSSLSAGRQPGSVSGKDERRWSGLGPGQAGAGAGATSRFGGGNGQTTPQLVGSDDGRMGPSNDIGSSNAAGSGGGGGGGASGGPPSFAPVTKWEHLNLHPDLLRAIQKYGLGPPNKIQQRALPFLLRSCDLIAQAPATQERIASYVIPALQLVLEAVNLAKGGAGVGAPAVRGPYVLIVSTTVDQATQAQRMALGLGSPLGVRVHMAAASSIDAQQEAAMLLQASPHIVVGTPAKMCDLWTYLGKQAQQGGEGPGAGGGGGGGPVVVGGEVRLVVLDEVDQLIARNLSDHVAGMLRILPMSRAAVANAASGGPAGGRGGGSSHANNSALSNGFPNGGASPTSTASPSAPVVDRQTAIFSNTVPQDVLNFAQSINLRETVRVLVRREGHAGGGVQTGFGGQGPANQSGFSGPGSAGPGSQPTFPGHSPAMGSMPGGYFGNPTHGHGKGVGPMVGGGGGGVGSGSNHVGGGMITPGTPGDPSIAALRGLRQYYLWVPVSGDSGPPNGLPFNHHGGRPGGAHGREMKLELIADLLEDMDFGHAVVYCGSPATMEAVTYKLASKGVEAMALHREMNHHTRTQMLAKFRTSGSMFGNAMGGGPTNFHRGPGGGGAASHPRKALVVCDLSINPRDVHQIPLILFYDMPRSVDEYKEKVSCAAAGGMARPGVCINVVTASGGPRADIEMLRTLECHLGCKMAELPMDPRQILNY